MTDTPGSHLSTVSDRNLYSRLERSFARAGDRPVVIGPGLKPRLTYSELRDEVSRYANALVVLGVEPGDRVTVQMEKSLSAVALSLATLKAGAVYQPLNTAYTLTEVEYFVEDAEPSLIVCDPSRQVDMRKLADSHGVRAVISLDDKGGGALADLAARMSVDHETVARADDDLAGLLYTSGTTGRSKGAMLTHRNLASNAETLCDIWAFTSNDVLIHALPIYHVHGLFVALHTVLLSGATLLWLDKFDARMILDSLSHATVLMGVPTFYTRLLGLPELNRESCRKMRLFISGSAPLLAETHRQFRERSGHAILERYGMTETGMITSNPYQGERIPGTVGYALPGVDVRIADAEGRELPRGEPGVIEVKGPNVFKGYWRNPAKTAEEIRKDGFFITGDVAVMNEDGRVMIAGRAKDLIITGGFNVYPREVEDLIDALPGVGESAAIGVPHPDFGEAVIAVITTTGNVPSEAELIAAMAERLAKFKLPKRVFTIKELPRNAMGKVQKAELRKLYADTFAK
ncbi:MAG: malonyl-CoA synthase [Rhizobiales bacterium]|nr:malonyl-CoA synthase [Hyphomicrobiales bacterium]